MSESRVHYELVEKPTAMAGYEAFFVAGFAEVVVPVERGALHRALLAAESVSSPAEQEEALLAALLIDRRGGDAWHRYLSLFASRGRSVRPAPLLPPGTVELNEGATILFHRDRSPWAFYLGCKAAARVEPAFRIRIGAEAGENYRWTPAEELVCLEVLTEALRRAINEGYRPEALESWLLECEAAGHLPGYLWLEIIGPMAPGRLADITLAQRAAAVDYLSWATRPVALLPRPRELLRPSQTYVDSLVDDDRLRFRAASVALGMGELRSALFAFEDLVRKHPREGELLWRLAEARLAAGDANGAAKAAEQADAEAPGRPEVWALLARAQLAAGRTDQAEATADRLRWLWWLGRDLQLMRAPILIWSTGEGRIVIERLDGPSRHEARYWVLDLEQKDQKIRPLEAVTAADALVEGAPRR